MAGSSFSRRRFCSLGWCGSRRRCYTAGADTVVSIIAHDVAVLVPLLPVLLFELVLRCSLLLVLSIGSAMFPLWMAWMRASMLHWLVWHVFSCGRALLGVIHPVVLAAFDEFFYPLVYTLTHVVWIELAADFIVFDLPGWTWAPATAMKRRISSTIWARMTGSL